jgi:hypothetical protein
MPCVGTTGDKIARLSAEAAELGTGDWLGLEFEGTVLETDPIFERDRVQAVDNIKGAHRPAMRWRTAQTKRVSRTAARQRRTTMIEVSFDGAGQPLRNGTILWAGRQTVV